MGAGRTFFCLFCLGLATLLTLQRRQSEVVSRLGQNRQSLDENKSEQLQKTIELSLEQRSSEIPSFAVSKVKLLKEKTFVQPELSELAARYKARRELVGRVCEEQSEDLEARFSLDQETDFQCPRYKARWPNKTWDLALAKADVLEKRDRGMLWCKVPKAASESWTGLFIKQWYGRKAKQLMWRQQVPPQLTSNPKSGFNSRCSCTQCGRPIGGRLPTSRPYPTLTSPSLPAGSFLVVPSLTYSYILQASF